MLKDNAAHAGRLSFYLTQQMKKKGNIKQKKPKTRRQKMHEKFMHIDPFLSVDIKQASAGRKKNKTGLVF